MIENPTVTSLRALQMEVALGEAISLSRQQAREIWDAMQLIATNNSAEGMPRNVIQLAIQSMSNRLESRRRQSFRL